MRRQTVFSILILIQSPAESANERSYGGSLRIKCEREKEKGS